jgi:hypothetical protein
VTAVFVGMKRYSIARNGKIRTDAINRTVFCSNA